VKNKENDTPKCCEYCRYASTVAVTEDILCEKKGIVAPDYSCRKFIYDPLKRTPRKPPALYVPEELTTEL